LDKISQAKFLVAEFSRGALRLLVVSQISSLLIRESLVSEDTWSRLNRRKQHLKET
jgi:hypothetical protein